MTWNLEASALTNEVVSRLNQSGGSLVPDDVALDELFRPSSQSNLRRWMADPKMESWRAARSTLSSSELTALNCTLRGITPIAQDRKFLIGELRQHTPDSLLALAVQTRGWVMTETGARRLVAIFEKPKPLLNPSVS